MSEKPRTFAAESGAALGLKLQPRQAPIARTLSALPEDLQAELALLPEADRERLLQGSQGFSVDMIRRLIRLFKHV